MARWDHGRGFSLDASVRLKARTTPAWSGCYAIVPARRQRAHVYVTTMVCRGGLRLEWLRSGKKAISLE